MILAMSSAHLSWAAQMGRSFMSRVSLWAIVAIGSMVCLTSAPAAHAHKECPTGFANFGDSLTDTGNALNAIPYDSHAESSPYGETFFGAPAKRFSNGRLVPDFFSLAFRKPLLDGYFATAAFNYKHGVNFAFSGATAAPSATAATPFSVYPVQVSQFIRFKTASKDVVKEGIVCESFIRDLPSRDPYQDWLFTITAGGNDFLGPLADGVTPATIISTIVPFAVGNMSNTVQTLYNHSARNFLIFNVPALGCSTILLTLLGNLSLPTDILGCIISINEVAQQYNAGLLQAIKGLRKVLPGVSISLFDYYSANIEILEHPTLYGFNPKLIFTACCGSPGVGTLNFNPALTCGHPLDGSDNCANPNEHVIWDAIHFTENFYRTISKFALSGAFTDHGTNYTASCNLDFSKFGPKVTLKEAYPAQCNNLFG